MKQIRIGTNTESDHQPIEIRMDLGGERRKKENVKLMMDWTTKGIERYKANLEKAGEREEGMTYKKLKEEIQSAIRKERIKEMNSVGKKSWDKECHDKKLELKKILTECKKGKTESKVENLKKKKAAGGEKIPNEAWLFSTEKVRRDLRRLLNNIWKAGEMPEEGKTGKGQEK